MCSIYISSPEFKGFEGLTVTERERGDNGMFVTLVHKLYAIAFLIVGNFGEFLMDFDWLVYLIEYQNGSITNCNPQNG